MSKAMPICKKVPIQILGSIWPHYCPRRTPYGIPVMVRRPVSLWAAMVMVRVPLVSPSWVFSLWSRNYPIMCKMVPKDAMLRILGSKLGVQQLVEHRSSMRGLRSSEGATRVRRTPLLPVKSPRTLQERLYHWIRSRCLPLPSAARQQIRKLAWHP